MTSTSTAASRQGAGTTRSDQQERAFRPDIEGLRAIAVGTVLIYHAGLPFFHGGFVGVDVFFVISGFLITGLLVAEIERTGRLSICRLLRPPDQAPAAGDDGRPADDRRAVVDVPVAAAPAARQPATSRARRCTSSTGASPARRSTTSPQGEDPSPVQHFWSLAVEEQFYLLWPLLLVVAAMVVRRRGWRTSPDAARVDRRLVGDVVRLLPAPHPLPARRGVLQQPDPRLGARRRGGARHRGAMAVPAALDVRVASSAGSGVAAILWAAITFTDATPFPGSAALWPVLGAAAVIAAGVTAGQERAGTSARDAADVARRPASRTPGTCGTGRCSSSPPPSGVTSRPGRAPSCWPSPTSRPG